MIGEQQGRWLLHILEYFSPTAAVTAGQFFVFRTFKEDDYTLYDENSSDEGMDNLLDGGSVACFDPGSNSWDFLPAMPTKREGFTISVLGAQIYAIGGFFDNNSYLGCVERLDPCSRLWEVLPSMPTPRSEYSASVLCGRLYIVGGLIRKQLVRCVECFDPMTGSWQALPSMTIGRFFHSASVLGGQLYIVGGRGFLQNDRVVSCASSVVHRRRSHLGPIVEF